MEPAGRISRKAILFVGFGTFSLPMLLFGGYLLICWLRGHTTDGYYVNYPYLKAAVIWIVVGVFSLLLTVVAAWGRSSDRALFAVPILLCFVSLTIIPDQLPHLSESMMTDSNYLSSMRAFFGIWYEGHHNFPANEAEFRKALAEGPAAWQYSVSAPESQYRQRGNPVPYQIVVVSNATGPRLADVSQRPGVVYYCVSKDLQEFWVTMTALRSDVARTATLKRVAEEPDGDYWMIHERRP
jgi:hypothetical protein